MQLKKIFFLILILLSAFYIYYKIELNKKIKANGITKYTNLSYPGYNLYNTRDHNQVKLLDKYGNIIRSWEIKNDPEVDKFGIHYSRLDQEGNLYAIIQVRKLYKFDWDGNIIWGKMINTHHDISFGEDNKIYTLDLNYKNINYKNKIYNILVDNISIMNPSGEIIKKINIQDELLKLLPDYTHLEFEKIIKKELKDIFHLNSIQYINKNIDGLCQKGDLLISARNLDLTFIYSVSSNKITWTSKKGLLQHQHSPKILDNNNILIFDNGTEIKKSRVIEINPLSNKVIWQYPDKLYSDFYSKRISSAQRLKNENTLITLGRKGRVLEVDKNKNIVWEFINPDKNNKKDGDNNRPGFIYRMDRYEESFIRNLN